jgi:hypothetical protein
LGWQIAGQGVAQSLVPVAGGAIVDGVAGLFFVQDRRTQQKMIDFFDKLREDRKLDEAQSLRSQVVDSQLRDRLQVLLSLHFAGLNDDQGVLLRQVAGEYMSLPGADAADIGQPNGARRIPEHERVDPSVT